MFKNVSGQKIILVAIDTATGAPKTGDAGNLTAYVSKDDGSVTVLGDTSATEIDATNAKGSYSFDLTQSETNADKLYFSGKSSTSGVVIVPLTIFTRPAGFGDLAIASGIVSADIKKLDGTAQSATDLKDFADTGYDPSTHLAQADVARLGGAAQSAADLKDFADAGYDPATHKLEEVKVLTGHTAQTGDAYAIVNSGTHGNAALKALIDAIDDYVDTEVAAIKAKTDNLPSDPADASDIASAFSSVSAMLTTIAGYIDTEVAAIKAKTDNLPAAPAATGDVTTAQAAILSKLLKYVQLLARKDAAIGTDNATEKTAINADGGSGAGSFDQTTDSQEAIRDRGDAAWTTATGFSTLDAAGVRSAVGLASANLDTQLDVIPTNSDLAIALAAADDAVLAAIAALNNLSVADVTGAVPTATQNADALLKRDWTSVSGEASRSVLNALRFLRNAWVIAGGTLSVKKEDDSTDAWTGVVTQTAGDPVSEIDPS